MFSRNSIFKNTLRMFLVFTVVMILFTYTVWAGEDNNMDTDNTIQKEKDLNKIPQEQYENTQSNTKENTDTRHNTSTKLNLKHNTSHITLNTTVESDVPVDDGYVIYKLNGVTLKDSDNNPTKVNITNSNAILTLPLTGFSKLFTNIETIYSGNKNLKPSTDFLKINMTKQTTNTTLYAYNNTTHIILKANINSDTHINTGYVQFKLNGLTIKNLTNNPYKVNVTNSTATINLPLSDYSKIYHYSEAVYSGSAICNPSRILVNRTWNTRLNPSMKVTSDKSLCYPGETVQLNITLTHTLTNNFNNGKVIFKLNGITLKNNTGKIVFTRIKNNNTTMLIQVPKGLKYNHINISIVTEGDKYNKVEVNRQINLKPLNTKINVDNLIIDNNNYCILNASIKDVDGENVIGKTFLDFLLDNKKVSINNKTQVYTINNGKVNLKVPLDQYKKGSHTLKLKLRADAAYNASLSKEYTINLEEKIYTKVIIDTPYKAKNGTTTSIRIYVTYNDKTILKTINKGTVHVKINNQTLSSKVTYGKAIFSYKLPIKIGTYPINVKYTGIDELRDSSNNKNIILTSSQITGNESSIRGNKDPHNERISLENGIPQLVYMTNYVWADENGKYTLTKNQLQEVFNQDSYSLQLNKHMSKYVSFLSTNDKNVYHVLRREKWNVIEKAVNKYLVKNSKQVLPANITVDLKGKEYTYGETRAIQSTEYTCGPTATSVCTQSLRHYVNEHTLATEFNTYKYTGTYARYIPQAMKKYNMSAENFYQNTFNSALDKLSKGGCSLVFYGVKHYVSIIDISRDKSKVLVSNSYGKYELGGGKIPNGWVPVSVMKTKFSDDSFGGLIISLNYNLDSKTKTLVNNLYNNFGSNWVRQNTNEELNT